MPMRKLMAMAAGIAAFSSLAAGVFAADSSQRRAREVKADNGSIKVRAGGVLNTTVEVTDYNRIANAECDFEIIEDHREALLRLGFTAVHVQTASGQSLEKPL
jgi:hypothetical protein